MRRWASYLFKSFFNVMFLTINMRIYCTYTSYLKVYLVSWPDKAESMNMNIYYIKSDLLKFFHPFAYIYLLPLCWWTFRFEIDTQYHIQIKQHTNKAVWYCGRVLSVIIDKSNKPASSYLQTSNMFLYFAN
jgi:hypothetical protein